MIILSRYGLQRLQKAFFVSLVPMYTFWVEVGISSKENAESDIFCFELKFKNSKFFPGIAAAHACLNFYFGDFG